MGQPYPEIRRILENNIEKLSIPITFLYRGETSAIRAGEYKGILIIGTENPTPAYSVILGDDIKTLDPYQIAEYQGFKYYFYFGKFFGVGDTLQSDYRSLKNLLELHDENASIDLLLEVIYSTLKSRNVLD